MIDLFVAWLLFPVVLTALALGCGLLVEAAAGREMPLTLLPAVGMAVIIVVGQFTTLTDPTAELTVPLVLALAIAGYWITRGLGGRRLQTPILVAALASFAVFAAPVVFTGEASFAGYIRLDDSATWFAITDQVMEHGRDVGGLEPSTHEATVQINLSEGYPVGAFVPLGVGSVLTGMDVAWVFQPFLSLLCAYLCLVLAEIGAPAVRSTRMLAAIAFVASVPALLVGYVLWGGIKEVEAALLVALVAALVAAAIARPPAGRGLLPLALGAASLLAVLGLGGAAWLLTLLIPAAILSYRERGANATGITLAWLIGIGAVLSIPLVAVGNLFSPTQEGLTSETEIGNLVGPLNPFQLAGIWPTGDFRVDPVDPVVAGVLIALVVFAAIAGLALAIRRGAGALIVYATGTLAGVVLISQFASPWVDGKALATASPVLLLLAGSAVAALIGFNRRTEAAVVGIAIVVGVAWSYGLAYRDVNLAPRDQLAELEEIGEEYSGEGPALMTEYNPNGARHFLRDLDAEGASELRRRTVPLTTGVSLGKGEYVDTDELDLSGLLVYRTLVLRRSPAQSRPPLPYSLVRRGDYYDVWQRPVGTELAVTRHLALGQDVDPASIPTCREVLQLSAAATPGQQLVAAPSDPVIAIPLSETRYTVEWAGADPNYPAPSGEGIIAATVTVPEAGDYTVWLGGSARPRVELFVDGESAGVLHHQLNNSGQYLRLGSAVMGAGRHQVEIVFGGTSLRPGSGQSGGAVGPLVLSRTQQGPPLRTIDPSRAGTLCGKPWDWIELGAPVG